MTTREKIVSKINAAPRGKLFTVSDFDTLGSYSSNRLILSELVAEGKLNRVYVGIYQKPNYSEVFQQNIPVSPLELAEVLARKNNWTITPAKDLALNTLGLDTQVPNRYTFISSGPSKKIRFSNGQEISFRNVTQREAIMAPSSALVIEAFKQLGKENVTTEVLKKVASKLNAKQLKRLERDARNSRVWIRQKIMEMGELGHD